MVDLESFYYYYFSRLAVFFYFFIFSLHFALNMVCILCDFSMSSVPFASIYMLHSFHINLFVREYSFAPKRLDLVCMDFFRVWFSFIMQANYNETLVDWNTHTHKVLYSNLTLLGCNTFIVAFTYLVVWLCCFWYIPCRLQQQHNSTTRIDVE